MTKKRELEVLTKSLMLEDGIRESRRIEFREKQERKRRQYAKKNKK